MKRENFLRLAISAALVLPGAALCAHAQSQATKKKHVPSTTKPVTPSPSPEPAAPQHKRNARESPNGHAATPPATSPAAFDKLPPEATAAVKSDAEQALYAYEFRQPESYVVRINIEHDPRGRGRVSFERKIDTEVITEPCELSPAALKRIMALWEALRFLETETNYQSEKQFPHMGTMRLRMKRGARERTAEFNWTHHAEASALSKEYRHVAEQAMLVFEIGVALENQPLEMPKLLNKFELLLTRKSLSDPTQLASLARSLSTDERIPLLARNHAERLLKKLEKIEPAH